jgi:hypothetical protein
MSRFPNWFRELEKSEREKLLDKEKTLHGKIESECAFFDAFEYSPNVLIDFNHKPKAKGDYRFALTVPGLKEEEILRLMDALEGCEVERG